VEIVSILAWVVHTALLVSFYVLWARIILDFVRQLRHDWRPQGFWLLVSVWLMRLTDPPLRFVRRFVKPVRIGQVSLDLSVLILFIVLIILMQVANIIATL